jgi:hypothetical protein
MRRIACLSLVALWAVAAAACAQAPAAPVPAGGRGEPWSEEVVAYGKTREDAEIVAWDEARDRVAAYLRRREPALTWEPTVEYLKRHDLTKPPRVVKSSDETSGFYEARMTLQVSDNDFAEVIDRDRQERSLARRLLWGKLLAGVVAVLALLAGYFRLEEWTRGYYTSTLRFLLAAGLGLVGAGVYLVL